MKEDLVHLKKDFDKNETNDANVLWDNFRTTLEDSLKKNVPQKTTRPRDSLPWVTAEMKKMMRKRDKLSCKGKKLGNKSMTEKSKQMRKDIKKEVNLGYWKYVGNLIEEKDENEDKTRPSLKRLFTFIKHQQKSSVGVAPLKSDGRLVTDPKGRAEILNAQFYKAFSSGEEYTEEEFLQKCTKPNDIDKYEKMPDINITDTGIEKLLKNLVPTKAAGPDGISPRVLKELAQEIAPLLGRIYRASLVTGSVPKDWRHALVSPVFKKGEHYEPINYRPVSLTSIPCKVMEHILVSNIMSHLEHQNILCKQQHGFRSGHSCETQLLEFIEDITKGLDEGKETDVIIMDFAKAFDRVNHSLLVHKLEYYGIKGMTNRWIKNFLSDRTQAVVVEGETSSAINVKSGVPQGSVLGPCLFLLYINDLPSRVDSVSRLFADDTLLHRLIATMHDRQKLQEDLKALEKWEEEWDMDFHPKKCNVLPVSRKQKKKSKKKKSNTIDDEEDDPVKYELHGHQLEVVSSAKYLGVTLDKRAEWTKHIDNIYSKANRLLGFLRRNLRVATSKTKELAYKALVRPVLEYSCCVWDPHYQKDIDKLEKIQRRAARYVLNKYQQTASVDAMLTKLKWPTLEERRRRARLNMMYKIHHKTVNVKNSKLKRLPARARHGGHDAMYERLTGRTNYRTESFFPRTVRDWNSLPQATVEAPSIGSFSARVAKS